MQRRTDFDRWTKFSATLGVIAISSIALANPQGEQVVSGDASFQHNGAETVITAANNTIINYQSFNIGAGEAVRFIQPDATSRVLNRVLDGNITTINGSLTANGQVYIANPAGVFFGGQAVVNVGSLTAAAGTITDAAFLSGVDHFTNLTGSVVNQGTLEGHAVSLIGQQVANYGSIVAPDGMVTMVAGDEVYLGQNESPVIIRMPDTPQKNDGAAVLQEGTVDAGENGAAMFGAADVYALAIHHGGTTKAGNITLSAPDAQVQVTGNLDASSAAGHGGQVQVLGKDVILGYDANINASGATGGGTVQIGGDYQGGGTLPTAEHTMVGRDVTISADATDHGDGGRIIVWSDAATWFYGALHARGGPNGGNGGFAEISGKQDLAARGDYQLGAPAGTPGTILFDPQSIVIVGGNGDGSDLNFGTGGLVDHPEATNSSTLVDHVDTATNPDTYWIGGITFDRDGDNSVPFYIYESEIESSPGDAGIILQARRSISVSGTFTDGDLVAASLFMIMTRNDDHDGNIDLTGSTNGYDLVISAAGTDSDNGFIVIEGSTSGAYISNVILPSLETSSGDIQALTRNGNVSVYGTVTTGANSDIIQLAASGNVSIYNTVTSKQGAIDLLAGNSVVLGQYDPDPNTANDETVGKLVSTSGNITLTADATSTLTLYPGAGGSDTVSVSTADGLGGITMHANSSIDAGSGDVAISAPDDIALSSVTTTSANAVTIASANGSITDANGDDTNVTATKLTLSAAENIGSITDMSTGDGDAIELDISGTGGITNVSTTAADSQINIDIGSHDATGGSGVFAAGAIHIAGANAGSAILHSDNDINASTFTTLFTTPGANDNIGLFSGGTLTIPSSLTYNEYLWLSGATDIVNSGGTPHTFTFSVNNLRFSSGGAADTTLNTTVDAITASLGGTSDLTINETDGLDLTSVTTAGGDISVTAHGAVTAGTVNASTLHNVSIITDTGTVTDSANTITADALTITAADGINVTTNVNSADLSVTGAGDITVSEQSAIDLTDVDTANGAINITAGGALTATDVQSTTDDDANDITLKTNSGAITAGIINAGNAGDVTLTSAGAINDTAGKITADNLTATAFGAMNLDTTVNTLTATTYTAGNLVVNETDAIDLTSVRTANGSIAVTSGGALNAILVRSNANSDANDIALVANTGDLTYQDVNAGTLGDLTVTATAGNIIDAGQLVGDQLTATAGGNMTLDTAVNSLSANATTPGDITVTEADALTVTSASTNDGFITISAGGNLTADNIDTSNTDNGSNDVSLTTTSGDIILGSLTAGSVNDASLLAAGSILDNNGDTDNITARNLSMNATTNIGTVTDFLAATGDAIELNLTGSLTSAVITAAGGAIYLDFGASTPTIPSDAIVPAAGQAAMVILEATGDLNVGTAATAIDDDAGDSLGFIAGNDLVIPDAGLSISGSGAQLLLRGDNDIYTETFSRTLTLAGPAVSVISGSAGGDTTLDTTVDNLHARLTGPANLVINETDSVNLVNIITADGIITATTNGDLTATNVDSSAVDDSTNDIFLTANAGGSIYVGTVNAGSNNDAYLTAAANINDVANTITADYLYLLAGTGINVHTNVTTADFHVTGTGNMVVNEADAITLLDVDTADGDLTINAGGNMTVVNANASDNLLLTSTTAIDGTTDGTADVTASRIDLSAPQIGQSVPVQIGDSASVNARGANIYLDTRNTTTGVLVGQIRADNQITINDFGNGKTIDSVHDDYTPDLWAKSIILYGKSIGTTSVVDVLAVQSLFADTHLPAPGGDIFIDFLAGIPHSLTFITGSGTVDTELELVTNVGDAMPRYVNVATDPTLSGLVDYLPDLPPADESTGGESTTSQPESTTTNPNDQSADSLNNTAVPVTPVQRLPQLGNLSREQFKARFQSAFNSYAQTWSPSLINPQPFNAAAFLEHLRSLALGTDQSLAIDAVSTLSGLNELARNIHLNGLDDDAHQSQRLVALQPYTVEGITAEQLDAVVMYLLQQTLHPAPAE